MFLLGKKTVPEIYNVPDSNNNRFYPIEKLIEENKKI